VRERVEEPDVGERGERCIVVGKERCTSARRRHRSRSRARIRRIFYRGNLKGGSVSQEAGYVRGGRTRTITTNENDFYLEVRRLSSAVRGSETATGVD
jgi:hypothetical protein